MVQFAGSYKIVSFEGTDGDLSKFIPESTIVEVKHEGNRYTFTQGDDVSVYEEGAETTNKFFWFPVKSTTQVSGDTITVEESADDGKCLTRTYEFSESGIVQNVALPDNKILTVKYKRI